MSRRSILLAAFACFVQSASAGILEQSGVRGGLVVVIDNDPQACAALVAGIAAKPGYVAHGLCATREAVDAARIRLRARRVAGNAGIARFDGKHLPYVTGTVNLLVPGAGCSVAREELERVLAPRGVLLAGTKWSKPVPDNIDEWTHYLHAADNNAVACDAVVDQPYHVQWIGSPRWARHHNHLSSTSAMVTSGGRVFAIMDEGPAASLTLAPKWRLAARDAFSGVVLWKKPIGPWEGVLRRFRSGPTELSRRLVAVGDRVFVTLGYNKPLTALDAATGEPVRDYAGTGGALEVLHCNGTLYVVAGTIDPEGYAQALEMEKASPAPRDKRILAIDAATGKTLWTRSDATVSTTMPATLCCDGKRAYLHNVSHVVCLDAGSGSTVWRAARPARLNRMSWSAPALVVHGGVVLSADRFRERGATDASPVKWRQSSSPLGGEALMGELVAFSAADGKELWRCPAAMGYTAPPDVLVADGLVWVGTAPGRNTTDFTEARDPRTGEVKRRLDTAAAFTDTHHHRCYRNKATDRHIILGRTGTEFIDLKGEQPLRHCWVRGACQYGVMPANGLLYMPPHACACYIQSKLSGFWALAPKRGEGRGRGARANDEGRLEKGPAYGRHFGISASRHFSISADWPTHRGNAARTGATGVSVERELKKSWATELGGKLTSPVIAGGVLLVADKESHTLHALDAGTGKGRWSRAVGAQVDSPPTIAGAVAVFGCADGHVYCLRLADGELVWRFRAAPADRRIVACGQVESVWPVTGAVLIRDGVVYCTAGRSSFLDGGMRLCRLELATGRLIGEEVFYGRDPETGAEPEEIIEDVELPGTLPDVLVCDGQSIYLRDKVLDFDGKRKPGFATHLYSSAGLLDGDWWHRTSWIWGERNWGRASGWSVISRYRPSGRILVTDEKTVFGYGRRAIQRDIGFRDYHLFRADKRVKELDKTIKNNNRALARYQRPAKVTTHWSVQPPLVARALVLTPGALLAAGPVLAERGGGARFDDAEARAAVMAFNPETGEKLSRCRLGSQPVFDGMAVAVGKVFVSTVGGEVVCLE